MPPGLIRASIVQSGYIEPKFFVTFLKGRKGHGQNNRSFAQLHHPSQLLKTLKDQCQMAKLVMVSTKWPGPVHGTMLTPGV